MRKISVFLCAILTSFVSIVVNAKEINLYDQPTANSKIINKIDPAMGIIPIYTPKDNANWVKVADPRNGNVGWIKSNELNADNVSLMRQQMFVNPEATRFLGEVIRHLQAQKTPKSISSS